MQKNTTETTAIAPFPPCIFVEDESYAELALYHARIFYENHPDAPRNVREARDEFDVKALYTDTRIVGSTDQPFGSKIETTDKAARHHISDLAIIDQRLDEDGRGDILFHSADINPDAVNDRNHRLLLVVWDKDSCEHYMADVSNGVRIENWHEYNEEVAARLEPNTDGTFSAPAGQVRYVTRAQAVMIGTKIIFQGLSRRVVACSEVEGSSVTFKHNGQVEIEFADGQKIIVPCDLEITYVDNAG